MLRELKEKQFPVTYKKYETPIKAKPKKDIDDAASTCSRNNEPLGKSLDLE